MTVSEAYLRAILATVARQTFPHQRIVEIMGPNAGEKQYRAFNMCDGSRTQSDVAKELSLDQGNFSRTIGRWIDEGIVIRVGDGREARPIHVYPLSEAIWKKAIQKKDVEN